MKTRLLAAVFVVCCLLLCGLILRRQIAAHPLPPEAAGRFEEGDDGQGQGRFWMEEGWQPAPPAVGTLAREVVSGQIAALKAGDGPKAWSYQSRSLRQNFGSPALFMQVIASQYPEFAHPGHVQYGPVRMDKSGRQVRALILLEGEDGRQVQAVYQLVREGGEFKVARVEPLSGPEGQR